MPPSPLRTRQGVLDFSRPYVLGVLNVTPDSFSDGGRFLEADAAVARGLELEAAGADLLDVGGESTRPGAAPVAVADEIARVVPVIARLHGRLRIPISVDTRRPEVAEAALRAGADLVNDVSGLADIDLGRVAARAQAAIIVGHLRGAPDTMQQEIRFHDVVAEVIAELAASVQRAAGCGLSRERIVVDPGLGFGKTAAQTAALLAATGRIRSELDLAVCVGPSRKSFLGAITGAAVDRRLMATAAAAAIAVFLGADIVRLHDVAELRELVTVAGALGKLR